MAEAKDAGLMDRIDFETSTARAKEAQSRTTIKGAVVCDFKGMTRRDSGAIRWHWVPHVEEYVYPIFNPDGGPAFMGYHRKTYWLCMGWSHLEILEPDDPRAKTQSGSGL